MMFAVLVAKTYEKPINSGKDLLDRGAAPLTAVSQTSRDTNQSVCTWPNDLVF